jgi:hypothetical protein
MNIFYTKRLLTAALLTLNFYLFAQIAPQSSPYYLDGEYEVVFEEHTGGNTDLYTFRPDVPVGETFPVFIFQLGANGLGSSAIDHTSYDLFMEHLASWGYIVVIIDDASAGLPNGGSFNNAYTWYEEKRDDPSHWMSDYADDNKVSVGGHSNGGVNATGFLQDHKEQIAGVIFFASYPSEGLLGIGGHDVGDFDGSVLSIAGNEDGQSTPEDCYGGYELFEETTCKYYVNIDGLGHGGFGDYVNPDQPVGSIGREDATASIRHFFISFLEFSMKSDQDAEKHLKSEEFQPTSTLEYESTCPYEEEDPIDEEEDPIDEEEDPIDEEEDPIDEEEDPIDDETAHVEEEEQILNVYPNPTSSVITIELNEPITSIIIMDNLGRVVYRQFENQEINLSSFPRGNYFIKINNQLVRKIVKH